MKKKILTGLLSAVMVLSMAACGGEEATKTGSVAVNESEEEQGESQASEEVQIGEQDLGYLLSLNAINAKNEFTEMYFNFPIGYSDAEKGLYYHMTCDQEDTETIAVTGSLNSLRYKVAAAEGENYTIQNVLLIQAPMIVDDIEFKYGFPYKDFVMEIDDGELVDVNGKEMCKHTGTLTYTIEGTLVEKSVVGYSVPASCGSYAFFVVCSLDAEKAETDARFIAHTVRETEVYEY